MESQPIYSHFTLKENTAKLYVNFVSKFFQITQ